MLIGHSSEGFWVCRFDWVDETYLNNAVHVWDKAVDSDLKQHDQCSANVLSHLGVFVCSQRKQTLSQHKDKSDLKNSSGSNNHSQTTVVHTYHELPQ